MKINHESARNMLASPGCIILPVGLPGCGKSTLAETLVAIGLISNSAIISTDWFRSAAGDRRTWVGDDPSVFRWTDEILQVRIRNNLKVYRDETNLYPERRNSAVRAAERAMRPLLCVRFSGSSKNFRSLRHTSGVQFSDDVWRELEDAEAAIDWAALNVAWIDARDLYDAIGGRT